MYLRSWGFPFWIFLYIGCIVGFGMLQHPKGPFPLGKMTYEMGRMRWRHWNRCLYNEKLGDTFHSSTLSVSPAPFMHGVRQLPFKGKPLEPQVSMMSLDFMVQCAQGLYVAGRGRIRKNSPSPGQYTIESVAVQALGRWANAYGKNETVEGEAP